MQQELLILSVQKRLVASRIFWSLSLYQFLTQCQTMAEICWRTFCQIMWWENWTWFYCFVVIKLVSLHDVMNFSNLTVRKIRFIIAGCRKYRQNVWNILENVASTDGQYNYIYFVKRWFRNRCVLMVWIHNVVHFFFKRILSNHLNGTMNLHAVTDREKGITVCY